MVDSGQHCHSDEDHGDAAESKKLDLAIAQAKNLLKHAATGHWRDKGRQPLDDQQQRQG